MNYPNFDPAPSARHPFGARPPESGAIEITRDIRWLQLTAEQAPLGAVNVWAIRDGDGWTIVDTGFDGQATRDQWRQLLGSHLPGPVQRVICTHFHKDHLGQAPFLQSLDGAPLLMTRGEWNAARGVALNGTGRSAEDHVEQMRRCGLPEQYWEEVAARRRRFMNGGLPAQCEFIADGDVLRIGDTEWEVEIGAGHSPAPALLFNRRDGIGIVGDQLMMRITPHIGVAPDDLDGDPLGDYLSFLDRARSIDPAMQALPGHGPVFTAAGSRAAEIHAHHLKRLQAALGALSEPRRCIDVVEPLFNRTIEGWHLFLALSETQAHLNYLVATGQARRTVDDEGCFIFERAA